MTARSVDDRRAVTAAGAVVALALAAVFVIVVLAVSHDRDDFGGGSFGDIEHAWQSRGVQTCASSTPSTHATDAVDVRDYTVALDCGSGADAVVVVDRFDDRAARDAALRALEVQNRPRASGVAYAYKSFVVFVRGSSDDAVQDRVDAAVRGIGAT